MASLRKVKKSKRNRRDSKIAKGRLKKTRIREKKQQETGALFL